jgi:hypothetical protein
MIRLPRQYGDISTLLYDNAKGGYLDPCPRLTIAPGKSAHRLPNR